MSQPRSTMTIAGPLCGPGALGRQSPHVHCSLYVCEEGAIKHTCPALAMTQLWDDLRLDESHLTLGPHLVL